MSIIYPVTFDSIDLVASVPGLQVLRTDPYAPAKRKLTIFDIARSDKSKHNSAFYKSRIITIGIAIARPTRALAEQSLDTLMGLVQGVEKYLVINQSGTQRKYLCTLQDANIKSAGGSHIQLDLVFDTSDHFGYDINPTLLLQLTGFTGRPRTDSFTVGGSAPWQVPTLTYTFTALTGGTDASVQVGNDSIGQMVIITRTWVAGDVLVINSNDKTVKVNGADVAFTGAIPEWAPGVGYLSYNDTLTTRTASLTMNYVKRYV